MLIHLLGKVMGQLAVVTLSGEAMSHIVTTPTNAESGLRVTATGFIQEQESGSFFARDSATDWILPRAFATADYDVRVTSVTGDAFTTSPGANGTWFDLGSDRTWSTTQTTIGSKDTSFTLEIRDPTGTTVSNTYTLHSEVEA